jgi:hypothetical protein
MVYLEQQDLQRLIKVLQQIAEFEDEKSRRAFLSLVGVEALLPRMDLTGSPFIASVKIINFLGAYGRLPNGVEALGSLLDFLQSHVGIAEQEVINEILTKYRLNLPAHNAETNISAAPDPFKAVPAQDASHQANPPVSQKSKVLIISSQADYQWLELVKIHLAPLGHLRVFETWDETRITTGTRIDQAIDEAMANARVALLLVSAHFLASEAIIQRRLPAILSHYNSQQLKLFPLILSSCLYRESPLGIYQEFNAVDQPLSQIPPSQVEEILVRLARALQQAL